MAKDITKQVNKLESETDWQALMAVSENKLVVVDIYSEWCGPCEAMLPTFARVFVEFEGADERLAIASASIAKLASVIQPTLPREQPIINLDKHGCLPIFAIYRHKSCIGIVSGPDASQLLNQITLNIPERPDK